MALEDDYGRGAAVGACGGWTTAGSRSTGGRCQDWDTAIADVERLHAQHRRSGELYVGASLLDRVPREGLLPRPGRSAMTEARAGLAVFRDLAATGMLAHDDTTELDRRSRADPGPRVPVRARDRAAGPTHLVKAVVWAVLAAHRPATGAGCPLVAMRGNGCNRPDVGFTGLAVALDPAVRRNPERQHPAEAFPDTVGPPDVNPGDPHGVVVAATEPQYSPPPPSIVASAWSGWPAEWQTPAWGQVNDWPTPPGRAST